MRILELKILQDPLVYKEHGWKLQDGSSRYLPPYCLRPLNEQEKRVLIAICEGRSSVELGRLFKVKPQAIASRLCRMGYSVHPITRLWYKKTCD